MTTARPTISVGLVVLWLYFATTSAFKARSRLKTLTDFSSAHSRWVARHCPDCNYDLASVLPANDELAGPRHCTECGAFWPLIPPDSIMRNLSPPKR